MAQGPLAVGELDDLALALNAAGDALGLAEVTLETLRARAPGDGDSLTETFAEVLLYIGLFFAIWATALYIREGSASR